MPVTLRHLDIEDLHRLVFLADNPAIANDMCTLPSPFKQKHARELIERSAGDQEVVLGIHENEQDDLAGVIMLRDFEPCHEQAEMSIWIGEDFWGRGIGSEAIKQMCILGFEEKNLNRIYAYTMVRNTASQRILEKSGFTREGLLRERVIVCGIHEDVYIYARLKSD